MKRVLIGLGIGLALLSLSLFLGRNALLNLVVERALARVPALAEKRGFQVSELTYDDASVDHFLGATFNGGRARLSKRVGDRLFGLDAQAGIVVGTASSYFPPRVSLKVQTVELQFRDLALSKYFFDGFALETLEFRQGVSPLQPRRAVGELLGHLDELVTRDGTAADIELAGRVSVGVGDTKTELRVHSVRKDNWTRLELEREDVRRLTLALLEEVSDEEVALMSEFPTRMPKIISLAREGRQRGKEVALTHPVVTRDSFRHLFWSYHLTREFGPEFAKRVTDAHETIPGNTPAERAMDYDNNALGRLWVAEGIELEALTKQILSDPRAVHRPRG